MLAAMYMLQRGTPFIYQGQEIGMTNIRMKSLDQFQDVMTHNGIRLAEHFLPRTVILKMANKASRENARTPVQWSAEENAGFTTGTPWIYPPENYRQINVAAQMDDETSIHAFYKKLVRLRKEMDVISEGRIEFLMKEDSKILAYRRYTESQELLVLCNLTGEEAPAALPLGWENAKILIANWDNAVVCPDLTLRPYECLALLK